MVKFYFSILFAVFAFCSLSQSLPYLNASTGNEGEFPVDKDTNIYMFHGNRLSKTDKNFNILWANTYGSITFSHLLLSKTGSMYFLANKPSGGSLYGKINSNGNLAWAKDAENTSVVLSGTTIAYPLPCISLLLDRNNQLVISGSDSYGGGFIFKTDTNGTDIMFKTFYANYGCMNQWTILEDSSGFYKIAGLGTSGSGLAFGLYTFSDISNAIISTKQSGIFNLFYVRGKFSRSKFNGNYYIGASGAIATPPFGSYPFDRVFKLNTKTGLVWSRDVTHASWDVTSLSEAPSGNLLCAMGGTTSICVFPIDSNGVVGTNYMYLNNNNSNIWSGPPQVIRNNDYYFYLTGLYFSLNPLTVQKFGSALAFSCSMGGLITSSVTGIGFSSTPNPTVDPVTSYTVPLTSLSVLPVTFSINSNYCQALSVNEIINKSDNILVFPNPATETINIGEQINSAEIYDVHGKKIFSGTETIIDVKELSNGIYFIRIKTDKGVYNKKFIKN